MNTAVDEGVRYHTLSRRLIASVIDNLVLFPLLLWPYLSIVGWLSDGAVITLNGISNLLMTAYYLIMHAKGGQTFGKRATNIRVVRADDETRIGWSTSLRRESPWVILITLSFLSDVVWFTLSTETNPWHPYSQLSWTISAAFHTWAFADPLWTLLNRKRRSLHDYIGGTVVVRTA